MALDMDQEHLLTCLIKDVKIMIYAIKIILKYVKNNYSKMSGAKQKSMAKIIQAWLKIKTSNVTKGGGNFSCKK